MPLDVRVCGSTSKVQERGIQCTAQQEPAWLQLLVSGQASLEAWGFPHGRALCLSLPGKLRLHVHGLEVPWGVCVRDRAHRDPLCCWDCTALPFAGL